VSEFRIVVGLRLDRPEYYLGFEPVSVAGADYSTVRSMLTDHLDELESQVRALRSVLATNDPEVAERLLQDGVRVQVLEVILRPRLSPDEFLPRLRESASLDVLQASDGAA
jgi:hypothetical protein